jgi:hypothetical protein
MPLSTQHDHIPEAIGLLDTCCGNAASALALLINFLGHDRISGISQLHPINKSLLRDAGQGKLSYVVELELCLGVPAVRNKKKLTPITNRFLAELQ